MFVEETGFSCRAQTGTTGAPRGHTPVLRRVSTRRALSTVIGLTLSGRLDQRHCAQAMRGEDMVTTLRHFQPHMPGPLSSIWDRRNAHRARVVPASVEAHPESEGHWLPPEAPDLHPEEPCHGHVTPHLRPALPTGVSASPRRGRSRRCSPPPTSRSHPRMLPACRAYGHPTWVKLNNSPPE